MMDTYSMHARHTVTGIVTGKPFNLGGSRGRREATGRGCMVVCDRILRRFGLTRHRTRVVVQGFGNVGSHAARLNKSTCYPFAPEVPYRPFSTWMLWGEI